MFLRVCRIRNKGWELRKMFKIIFKLIGFIGGLFIGFIAGTIWGQELIQYGFDYFKTLG